MSMALVRAALGPTVFDRVLALNMFGTKTVLMISVVSFIQGRTDFIDVALLYSLMNFIGMVALLRFVRSGGFVESLVQDRSDASDRDSSMATSGGVNE